MNNWCICWLLTYFLLGILIFKGLTARRLYKSFGVKWLSCVVNGRENNCKCDGEIFCKVATSISENERKLQAWKRNASWGSYRDKGLAMELLSLKLRVLQQKNYYECKY
jgi:hypothetical protein